MCESCDILILNYTTSISAVKTGLRGTVLIGSMDTDVTDRGSLTLSLHVCYSVVLPFGLPTISLEGGRVEHIVDGASEMSCVSTEE